MSQTPGNEPHDENPDGPDPKNPFAGTPFEQLFSPFGTGDPGATGNPGANPFGFGQNPSAAGGPPFGGQMPDLNALMAQMQRMMAPHDGTVNWEVVQDQARQQIASSPDPSPTAAQRDAVADAVRLADHWLEETTQFPSGATTAQAWSRAEWLTQTIEVWRTLVEPVAERAVGSFGEALPEEMLAMAGPLSEMISRATSMMVGTQISSALAALAGEVLTASDIGVPVGPAGTAALMPTNIASFAEGLDVSGDDVLLYLALREAAHQRLFAHVPWLRDHLIEAITSYAQGVQIDTSAIEEQMRGLDPSNPQAMMEAMSNDAFAPKTTPAQAAALEQLELTLALIEGWVDEVVGAATATRMPAAEKLVEAVRRRRATGGPAEQTFANLVGLELRPRRMREAATLWASLRDRQGIEARDGVWMHPALLPTLADLEDPLGFREDAEAPQEMSPEEFDAELARLLAPRSDEQ